MDKLKLHSPDFVEKNIATVAELFPSCVVEAKDEETGEITRKIDFDQLRQELSSNIVEGPQERYRLDWPGKREALLAANAPIAKTLRPVREESVDFDTTKNLFIEGDNLDALKLLQETYLGKVKVIYIDPPYNTGNDFVYDDDFAEDAEAYFERSNQKDESGKLVSNPESKGRFHSDWLTMMYSRLKLARNLLSEDGIILISLDDGEIQSLRKICDEVFGSDCFLSQFIWKSRVSEDTRATSGISTDHEYIVAYSRGEGVRFKGVEKDLAKFSNPDKDPRGPWRSADMTGLATIDKRPNLHYDLVNPKTGINYGCPIKGWRFEQSSMSKRIEEERILWPESDSGRPRQKLFLEDMSSLFKNISSLITFTSTSEGTRELNELVGSGIFDFPKPVSLLKLLVDQTVPHGGVVLDFFAGSSTSAHAVLQLNAEDGGNRRFIMVQLPEVCEENSTAYKAGYKNISEISKERIRRAGTKIKEENATTAASLDTGFRVLKVDTSNVRDIYYTPDQVSQDELDLLVDHVKEDRDAEDLLFQVMLDWGVDLSLPVQSEVIHGKTVYFVDENAIAACFDTGINEEFIKELAKREPLRAVFRDSGFANDAVKINVAEVFKLLSPSTELKTL